MALVSKNPITSIFLLNVLLLSTTLVLIGYVLRFYLPIVIEASVSLVPELWTTLTSWFTPSYLFLVVNFIIIAIAASSRFQHRNAEGASAIKIQADSQKESYDAGRKNSFEYKAELEGMVTEMYRHLDGKQVEEVMMMKKKKKPVELVVEARKKPVPEMCGRVEVIDLDVKEDKKAAELSEPKRVLEVRTQKKSRELGVATPNKHGQTEAWSLNIHNKERKSSAKEGEQKYSRSKSTEMPNRMNTVEIPMDYSYSEEKPREEFDEDDKAGKEVRATDTEENDTLDGTWKMIMESRRLHDAGLQAEGMLSPSQSTTTKKQERFNW